MQKQLKSRHSLADARPSAAGLAAAPPPASLLSAAEDGSATPTLRRAQVGPAKARAMHARLTLDREAKAPFGPGPGMNPD